jgi:hypothetical protein
MAVFFVMGPNNVSLTDNSVIRTLHTRRGGKTKGKGGYMFQYTALTTIAPRSVWTPHQATAVRNITLVYEIVNEIMEGYDFIVVVERMDESLVAMALLTGLELSDVLITNSKVAGKYTLARTGSDSGTCYQQPKGTISPGVQEYFDSASWRAMNYGDYVLYAAANASLDRTIHVTIGLDRFNLALAEFRRLKARALQACGNELGNGCSSDGQPVQETACYVRDFGCGYRCIDKILPKTSRQG